MLIFIQCTAVNQKQNNCPAEYVDVVVLVLLT